MESWLVGAGVTATIAVVGGLVRVAWLLASASALLSAVEQRVTRLETWRDTIGG